MVAGDSHGERGAATRGCFVTISSLVKRRDHWWYVSGPLIPHPRGPEKLAYLFDIHNVCIYAYIYIYIYTYVSVEPNAYAYAHM